MTDRVRRSVLVTGDSLIPGSLEGYIGQRGYQVRRVVQDLPSEEDLRRGLDGVSGYLIGGDEHPSAELFEAAPQLEVVAWTGTDFRAYVPGWRTAFELGIAFINCPGANANAVAEFTMLLMLSMLRPFTGRIATADGSGQATGSLPGRELRGKTVGLIGVGRIGAAVAGLATAFGADVVYNAPRRKPDVESRLRVEHLSMPQLLATSDVISLHRPAPSPGAAALFGSAEFDQMKPGAILVNTVHPTLVDGQALLSAVHHKGVRAAFDGVGSDGVWGELLELGPPSFLGLAQMAYHTDEAIEQMAGQVAKGICDVLDGLPAENINNPDFRQVRRSVRQVR